MIAMIRNNIRNDQHIFELRDKQKIVNKDGNDADTGMFLAESAKEIIADQAIAEVIGRFCFRIDIIDRFVDDFPDFCGMLLEFGIEISF